MVKDPLFDTYEIGEHEHHSSCVDRFHQQCVVCVCFILDLDEGDYCQGKSMLSHALQDLFGAHGWAFSGAFVFLAACCNVVFCVRVN